MNWFKKAYSKDPLKQLFNYIKQSGITIDAFHGTASVLFQDVAQKGYFKSPTVTKTEEYELRKKGLNQVFLTPEFQYAAYYAVRSGQQTNSAPMIVNLTVPMYTIAELQYALGLGKPVYNEVGLDQELKSLIDSLQDKTINGSFSQAGLKSFSEHIQNIISNSKEFTANLVLSDRFIKSVMELDHPDDSDDEITGWKEIDPGSILGEDHNNDIYNISPDESAIMEISDPSSWFKRPYKRMFQRTDLPKEQVLQEIEQAIDFFKKQMNWGTIQSLNVIRHDLKTDAILPEIARQSLERLKEIESVSPTTKPYVTEIYEDIIRSD